MNLKQKNTILLASFLLLVWIAYVFSFSKTIEAMQNFYILKQENELFMSASQNIDNLKQQVNYYHAKLNEYQISSKSSFQNNLLNTLNDSYQKNHLKIISFKDPHHFQIDNNAVQETYTFTVESDYSSVINLIYSLEKNHKYGKIISANFEKKKDYKTNKEYLQCQIYLQKISQE
ncbi:MAG: hypothetical protein WC389_04605 [Lutibacter sp.]|jgi:uncharacterized protein YlxW (UPF0749 family)